MTRISTAKKEKWIKNRKGGRSWREITLITGFSNNTAKRYMNISKKKTVLYNHFLPDRSLSKAKRENI